MNKQLILALAAVAGIGVIAFPPAQARDTFRSSPFHRCAMAALAVKPGEVVKAEQYVYEGRQGYEIDILGNDSTRWELTCDLATIKIVNVQAETGNNDRPTAQPYASTGQQSTAQPAAGGPGVQVISPQPIFKVSEERAKQIALGQYPGQLTQVVYEYSNGRPGYEIHIRSPQGTRIEVEIDGITGEVIEVSERPR
jgi:uncharacterized membrane protein YkoI